MQCTNQKKLLALITLVGVILATTCHALATDKPIAVNGILDLTEWDWSQDGVVALDGQWEFYWQQLLTPADFPQTGALQPVYITVPRAWNKHLFAGVALTGDGYATYRLIIRTSSEQILGIKIPRMFTAYNLWVNGQLLSSNGRVAATKDEAIPQYLPTVKYLQAKNNCIELVVQVTNFHHRSGGMLESLSLGSQESISQSRTHNLAFELFLFGSLFIIGIYHLGLFSFRTKDKSTLYFGIYAVLIALRTLVVGEIYFIYLFPKFSWEIAHKIQTLAYYLGVPLVISFLKSIFPLEVSVKANRVIQSVGLSFALLVLLTPARIFTRFNHLYQVFTVVVITYALFVLVSACYRKREGSYLIGVGVAILSLFTINDILFLSVILADSDAHFLRHFITRGNLSSWGLLILTFAQSLVLAKKFSQSFTRVELITDKLQELNESLEDKVVERTQALQRAYHDLSKSEKSRQHLVQNISHDLRTPLTSIQGYVRAVLDGIVQEPEQQRTYLTKVIDKVASINFMVGQLMELSQLESRQTKLDLNPISLKKFFDYITDKYSLDFQNANVSFQVDCPSGSDEYFINVDLKQLDRVFGNLLNNAVAFTPEGGEIRLTFKLIDSQNTLLTAVSDTGKGIPPEDLDHIFERFYKVEKARQTSRNSSGLGLAIAKEIVAYHGGNIWVESELAKGTNFFFTIPVQDHY